MISAVLIFIEIRYVRRIHADFNANENYAACPELQAYLRPIHCRLIVSWNEFLRHYECRQYF